MILYFIISVLTALLIAGLCFFISLYKKYKKSCSDFAKILLALKRLRYGDINVRCSDLNDKLLENSINRLIETIYDREMMIKEYQSTLSKKNLSLEEVLNQEKQLRSVKEEFAATLTHDMKVAVIAELNSLNYLLEGRFGDLNDKQCQVLELMKSSNLELKELIENMLEVYKLEQDKLKLNLSEYNLSDFLNSVINEMQPIASNSKLEISAEFNNEIPIIITFDNFQIKRVIKNLIQNAISFGSANSVIDISAISDDKNVKISVKNKGCGISEEDLELIFHKYYTGQSKFKKLGTGLGLYLSRQIIMAHGGDISVKSKGGFTEFIITLPVKCSP